MVDRMGNENRKLEQLWAPHRAHLRRLLISLAGDLDLAEDLPQDTCLRALQAFPGYRGETSGPGWQRWRAVRKRR